MALCNIYLLSKKDLPSLYFMGLSCCKNIHGQWFKSFTGILTQLLGASHPQQNILTMQQTAAPYVKV